MAPRPRCLTCCSTILCISSFQLSNTHVTETNGGPCGALHCYCTTMATQPWYPVIKTMLVTEPCLLPKGLHPLYLKHQETIWHPLHKKLQFLSCHLSGSSLNSKKFQAKLPALSPINSWRVGTRRQYQTCLKKCADFCCKQKIDPVRPTLTMILDFLTEPDQQGQQY